MSCKKTDRSLCQRCANYCDVMSDEPKPQREMVKGCAYGREPSDGKCSYFNKKNREK